MSDLAEAPTFPPLMRGERVAASPFAQAIRRARDGADPGLVVWRSGRALDAAVLLAPEVPLGRALEMVPAGMVALRDALGSIGPSEMPVHFDWPATVRVNGGRCGALRAAASTTDPAAEPDWLVLGLSLAFAAPPDGGRRPDETGLYAEGAGDLTPEAILESWTRHLMHRITEWEERGPRVIHDEWTAAAWKSEGWVGLDEEFGAIRKGADGTTRIAPLTEMLE